MTVFGCRVPRVEVLPDSGEPLDLTAHRNSQSSIRQFVPVELIRMVQSLQRRIVTLL
jgi:hypothetical protein